MRKGRGSKEGKGREGEEMKGRIGNSIGKEGLGSI